MKQINISVSFDDEKLRALNKYLKKKELTAQEGAATSRAYKARPGRCA